MPTIEGILDVRTLQKQSGGMDRFIGTWTVLHYGKKKHEWGIWTALNCADSTKGPVAEIYQV